jgi:UPF0755 protein
MITAPVKFLIRCFVLIVLAALLAGGAAVWWLQAPLSLASDSIEVSIEPGTSPREVANLWAQAGVRSDAFLLYEWFRWSGQARKIRAGSYQIGTGATPRSLLDKMVRGDEVLATVRLIDGWTFRQFRAELRKAPDLKQTTASMGEAELMAAIGAPPGQRAEGRFFPDTYAFSKGASDVAVLKRAHRAMQRHLEAAWAERSPSTPLKSMEDALVLASIVEKETGAAAERGLVAGVFVNRLRIGMPMQTDPTVIYGLGESFDGNLRKRDLQADGPYNSYLRAGLPPTPISMPGKASLFAAVRPDSTKALYFVAKGNGASHFSDNLTDHNRAVNQYQR